MDPSRRAARRTPLPLASGFLVASATTALFVLAGCSGEDGSPPTEPPGPTTGSLEVTAATTGDTLDPDGYTVALDGGEGRALDADGTVTYEDLSEGDHELELTGVQVNCEPADGPTRTVTVTAGETATVGFEVACAPALFDRIVFHREAGPGDTDLHVVAPDGSGVSVLRDSEGFDLFASLSPSGTRVAFQDHSDGDSEIAVMGVDGSGFSRLTDNDVFDGSVPSWSPDGTRIAFNSFRDGDGDVFVMNADGSEVTQLTDNDVFDAFPAWSPDGERIAYGSDRSGTRDIHVMNADGSEVTRLTEDPALERNPTWSPDGERIAFERAGDIYVMNADGSGAEQLAGIPAATDFRPSWSPDGERIVFESDRDGDAELWIVNADGTGEAQLLDAPATEDLSPQWGPERAER